MFIAYIILFILAACLSFHNRKTWLNLKEDVADDIIATIFQIRLNIFIVPLAIFFYGIYIVWIDNRLEDLDAEISDGIDEHHCGIDDI